MDDQDLIRKELKYAPTPMLLLLNKDKLVLDAFSPTDTLEKNYSSFLKACLTVKSSANKTKEKE